METVPFVDLKAQYRAISEDIQQALSSVFQEGQFVLGQEVDQFERHFAQFLGVGHAIAVGSGLDALTLALKALGIGHDDEVIIPANTYIATALAVSAVGAKPVLVDCLEETFQIDPSLVEQAITSRTKAIIPVHLYGHPADMGAILGLARTHGVAVVEDAAQAHGARLGADHCGTFGQAGCFSFFPGKNLGAYGDGGMVVSNDEGLATTLRQLRNYGQLVKHHHRIKGVNSRLDTIQAAVLEVKLRHLPQWNRRRAEHAAHYRKLLDDRRLTLPIVAPGAEHVYHLFVLRVPDRDELQRFLDQRGIKTGIHYPIPIHLQEAYADLGSPPGSFPVTEKLAREILSLPMFPELSEDQIAWVAQSIHDFYDS